MADLVLSGTLDLVGVLDLAGDSGGKVKIDGAEALVVGAAGKGTAPVILPPPPAPPLPDGQHLTVIVSFNQTVKAGGKAIVTLGMCLQGNQGAEMWPGMIQPSIGNPTVTVNNIPINVVNDMTTTLPNGAPGMLTASGQQ